MLLYLVVLSFLKKKMYWYFTGRIDAFTSKLIMLEKISPEILREKLGLIKWVFLVVL